MNKEHIDPERVTRITKPTASFSLNLSTVQWIAQEAIRRKVSKSEVVEDALTTAKREQERAA
jgi:hypothetical protein